MADTKAKAANPNPPRKKTVAAKPVSIDPQKEMYRQQQTEVQEELINFKSRDEVIEAYYFLVQMIAANIIGAGKIPPNMSFEDLMSFGISGLVKAWENFKPKKGVKFKVYASYRIRGEILDKIRKEWKYQNPGGYKSVNKYKVEGKVAQAALDTQAAAGNAQSEEALKNIAANTGVAYLLSFEDSQGSDVVSDSVPSVDEQVTAQIDFAEDKKALWDAVRILDEDEKRIIKLFYIDDKSQKEISTELGYSKSKISRMHAAILHKLRLRLKRRAEHGII